MTARATISTYGSHRPQHQSGRALSGDRAGSPSYLLVSYPQREPAVFKSTADEAANRNDTGNGTKGDVLGSELIALPEQSAEPYWSGRQW